MIDRDQWHNEQRYHVSGRGKTGGRILRSSGRELREGLLHDQFRSVNSRIKTAYSPPFVIFVSFVCFVFPLIA